MGCGVKCALSGVFYLCGLCDVWCVWSVNVLLCAIVCHVVHVCMPAICVFVYA